MTWISCTPDPHGTFTSDGGFSDNCPISCNTGYQKVNNVCTQTTCSTLAVSNAYYSSAAPACSWSCNAGYYSPTASNPSSCIQCAAGTYSVSGATVCSSCPAGNYAGSGGQSTCLSCSSGYAASTGQSVCSICTAGNFAANSARLAYTTNNTCVPRTTTTVL